MAIEIEVKARVRDKDSLIQKLEASGCKLGEPIEQHDTIFFKEGDVEVFKASGDHKGLTVLRIRRTPKGAFFTLKQNRSNGEQNCIEHETGISDSDAMQAAIPVMGFKEGTHVHKIRRKGHLTGNHGEALEVCLDEVTDLGVFIELEKMAEESEDGPTVQAELYRFLEEKFGIGEEDHTLMGYDTMMENKGK